MANIVLKQIKRNIVLRQTGRPGPVGPVGPPASNIITSVNEKIGDVVLTTDDIADSATNRYTNDTDIDRLADTSGVNTGNQDLSGLVPNTRTVNGHALSGNIVITKGDVGLGNTDNTSDTNKPVSTAQATAIAVVQSDIDAHEANTSNPHSVTKVQVGLGNVDNTSDSNKPVSTATQTALDLKQNLSEKGIAGGYPSLDGGGKVPVSQLPSSIMEYQGTWNATTNSPTLVDGTGNTGDVYRITVAGTQNLGSGSITFDVGDYIIYSGSIWQKSDTTDSVPTVFGRTGNVTAQSGDYTAGKITNAPAGNIAATDVQTALNELDTEKVPTTRTVNGHALSGNIIITASDLSLATVASTGAYSDLIGVPSLGTLAALNSINLATNVGATVLPVANGGTGSATQNFVDLSTDQASIAGAKTFTTSLSTPVMNDTNGLPVLTFTTVGSPISNINISNSTVSPVISAISTASNSDLSITPKGTGNLFVAGASNTGIKFNGSGARVIFVDNGTAGANGQALTTRGGNAATGTADKNGGTLFLTSGTSTGAGTSIIQFSTSTPGTGGATTANAVSVKATIDSNGNLGLLTAAPTHTLTLASTSTGIAVYNTSDQTTNYERLSISVVANVYTIQSQIGGTGSQRAVAIASGNGTLSMSGSGLLTLIKSTSTGATQFSISGTQTQSSTIYTGLSIAPTITQTSTGGYTGLLINPTESTVGTGLKLLADFQVGSSSLLSINNAGQIVTHSTASAQGHAFYNTTDEVTNFERALMSWSSNTFSINVGLGGTGSQRSFALQSAGSSLITLNNNNGSLVTTPKILLGGGTTSVAFPTSVTNTFTSSTIVQNAFVIAPTITQTSSGGYSALVVNPTESTTGSGVKRLLDLQVGGTTKVSVRNDGVISPVQAPTASAPTYVEGGIYYDTTLHKLRVGGASGWETITST